MATPVIYRTTSSAPDLSTPYDICVDYDTGNILICDGANSRIVLCNNEFKELAEQDTIDGTDDLSSPTGCCYYDGSFYVSDAGQHVVVRYRARDLAYKDYHGTIGTSGNSNTLLSVPYGLCVAKGELYVCDQANNRIKKLSLADLSYLSKSSSINGSLSTPYYIASQKVGRDWYLVVCDTGGGRVIKFKTNWTYICQNSASFTTPNGIAILNDMIYVGDTNTDTIIVVQSIDLTEQAELEDTTVELTNPYGLDAYRNSIYITDSGGDRITVWRAYNPLDDLESTDSMKFGSKIGHNPSVIAGDSLVAGQSGDYSALHWVEETDKECGFVEESTISSTWTEE